MIGCRVLNLGSYVPGGRVPNHYVSTVLVSLTQCRNFTKTTWQATIQLVLVVGTLKTCLSRGYTLVSICSLIGPYETVC